MGVAFLRHKGLGPRVGYWVSPYTIILPTPCSIWAPCAFMGGRPAVMAPQSQHQNMHIPTLESSSPCLHHGLHQLDQPGDLVSFQTLVFLLRWCSTAKALSVGRRIHKHILQQGLGRNMLLGSLLVQMYGECGALEEACAAFANMQQRNVFACNVLIRAFSLHGPRRQALCVFRCMQHEGITPDKITFVSILSVCASEAALAEGKHIHTLIVDSPFMASNVLRNALVNMYGKCGSLEEAQREFDKLSERNVISWTVMITAYAQRRLGRLALQLFQQMQQEGTLPDKVTFASILDACASHVALREGEQMHVRIASGGLESDTVVGTALINLYGKCKGCEDAHRLFDKMVQRNVVAWTAMIAAYVHHGQGKEALLLFDRMQWEGFVPNKVTIVTILDAIGSQQALVQGKQIHAVIVGPTFDVDALVDTALINMYGKCRSLEDAKLVFDQIPNRDVVTWTALIAVSVQNRQGLEGFYLFFRMLQEGMMPNKVTFVSILDACASQAGLEEGKRIHVRILESGLQPDIVVANALVDMYGKCGSLSNARKLFDTMCERDMVSWNTMIAVYARHGHGKTALHLFHQMRQEGMSLDNATFVSILSACSHAGLVDEGVRCFVSMNQDHHLSPVVSHFNCLIDLLSRAGRLDEAEDLINSMRLQPSRASWITLLGACRYQVDAQRGERAAKLAFDLDQENAAAYLMLSKIYAAAGKVDDNGFKETSKL